MGKDYYKILEIPKSASDDEIKKGMAIVGRDSLSVYILFCSVQETGTEMASRSQFRKCKGWREI
jgi:hypothetical protein